MIPNIDLIPATPNDAQEICDLLNIAYRGDNGWTTEAGLVEGDRTSVEQVVESIADENAFFLVHKALGKIVSCICIENLDGRIFIGSFAVNPEYQASGLGSATLNAAEKFAARKFSSRQFSMIVLSNRHELISFYERRGYKRTGKTSPYPVHLNVGQPILAGLTTEELMKNTILQGGCLCGSARYQITGESISSSTCFCQSCRRAGGAAAVAWFVVHKDQYTLLAGTPGTYRSSEPVTRTFCPQCGTPLSYQHSSRPDEIELTTATLDQPEAIPPEEEIWLSHKVGWAVSDPRLPHFAEDNPKE